ncbi:MAG: MoaD/ThiS family protein [bacterium]
MIKIKVKYFSTIRELLKKNEEILEIPEKTTIKDLINLLYKRYPALKEYPFLIAKNLSYANKKEKIHDNDEIALIPPVSGG